MGKNKPRRGRKGRSAPPRQRDGSPGTLNRVALTGLGVHAGSGVDKLAENISGCIDKNVITAVLNGIPTSHSGINKAIREAVLEGFAAADVHRTWLAELDRIARNAESLSALQKAIHAYVRQAGIERVDDPKRTELYRVVGKHKHGAREVVQPPYVDSINGRLILAGHLRYVPVGDDSAVAEQEPESK